MDQQLCLRMDGELCAIAEGQTILEVARANGIRIPTLCHLEGLSADGSCRLCLVQVAGTTRLLPACSTRAEPGMAVTTHSAELQDHRRRTLELLLVERNHTCAVCVSNGHCELQALAQELGLFSVTVPYNWPKLPVDLSHPRYALDHNRCVLCTRCVRVCDEIEGAHVWDIAGRGIESRLVCELDRPWGQCVSCTSCGKCVEACPTGALVEKGRAVAEMAKRSGAIARLAHRRDVQP